MTQAPQERRGTATIYEGGLIRVRVDTVGLRGGMEVVREVVEHRDSVVVVPIDQDGSLLLVRQYRYAVGKSLLEAPAGLVEPGESPFECAQRELQEEVGYAAGDLRPLGGFWVSPGFCTQYMHAFLAQSLFPSRMDPDDDEEISVERVPLDDAGRLIESGEIEDCKTIAALSMARAQLAAQAAG